MKTNLFRLPLLFMAVSIFISGCWNKQTNDNKGQENVPVLTTTELSDITQTSAKSGGNITDDGEATVTARGVCWSTTQKPTINDNKTKDGAGEGSFTSSISDLEPNTTYYVRAYATDNKGTVYGQAISFTTKEGNILGKFTDPRDGKAYQTVTIGNQEWMAENLAYAPDDGGYWAYDDNNKNVAKYGYLYDWETARNVCPDGWHLPSDEEWTELTDYLGGEKVAGKLKATGTIEAGTGLWYDSKAGATNESGFAALPGGCFYGRSFDNAGMLGCWWSSTIMGAYSAWARHVYYTDSNVRKVLGKVGFGHSVRCVRD